MTTINDVVKLGEKYGLAISLYQDKFYLQPVSIVGDRVYLQSAAPVWKKDGREQVGRPKIVSFGLGDKETSIQILRDLIKKIEA